ncbi:MAG: agmatine deiminase family protein [Chitinophagales bacterium]|nr:agmatine deiminase family protein [Chitinophagales bacterium]
MKKFVLFCVTFLWGSLLFAQLPSLPHGFAPWEIEAAKNYIPNRIASGYADPPAFPVRAAAEWEEIEALMVTWTSYIPVLTEIVRYAREECKIYIICTDSNSVKSTLTSGGVSPDNIYYVEADYNSIWCRDYGQWNVYKNNVDSLYLVDWIYNRPRPDDDAIPSIIAEITGLPIYQTISPPYDLVATGGNFMTDGWGTAFSSELILDENDGTAFSVEAKTEDEIDTIVHQFMGIHNYIKMETLPYDEIHHIDMHLKLLDEETLLVGEYPEGVADGPQIEENLQYILDNYTSVFDTPYKVVRIPMPPDNEGQYPDAWNGDYRTYTNCVFINKTVIVPVYEEEYDTTALRILKENLPGYRIVGIDCNDIIQALGAIHCITKEVMTNDPLVITHQPLQSMSPVLTEYEIDGWILHNNGINSAEVYYTTDTLAAWNHIPMSVTDISTNTFTGFIPAQPEGETVYYYIHATANNGKDQVRPITAPAGFWKFKVEADAVSVHEADDYTPVQFYPNPVDDVLHIINDAAQKNLHFVITDIAGNVLLQSSGTIASGTFITDVNVNNFPAGTYLIQFITKEETTVKKFIKL